MIRKMIVIAFALVALAAAPASAQYGTGSGVEGAGTDQGSGTGGSGVGSGSLARTGNDLNEEAILGAALIMAGGMAVVVGRRPARRNLT